MPPWKWEHNEELCLIHFLISVYGRLGLTRLSYPCVEINLEIRKWGKAIAISLEMLRDRCVKVDSASHQNQHSIAFILNLVL